MVSILKWEVEQLRLRFLRFNMVRLDSSGLGTVKRLEKFYPGSWKEGVITPIESNF